MTTDENEPNVYQCHVDVCPEAFDSEDEIQLHWKAHGQHEARQYSWLRYQAGVWSVEKRCPYCEIFCMEPEHLMSHLKGPQRLVKEKKYE